MKNAVGPVLRMSDDIDAIIAAIEEDNPGTEIEVIDRGAYVRIQAEQRMKVTRASIERHIGRTFEMRQLEPMTPQWLRVLSIVFTPMRYPAHVLQMMQAYLGQIAPSSYITNCAAFAAADLLRQMSLVAYRTRQLQMAHPAAGFVTGERQIWETHPDWQPTRRALETALVAYDWGECLTAVNLVLRPTLSEILLRQLGIVADTNHDQLTWLLLSNLAIDAERNAGAPRSLAMRSQSGQRTHRCCGTGCSAGRQRQTRQQRAWPLCSSSFQKSAGRRTRR